MKIILNEVDNSEHTTEEATENNIEDIKKLRKMKGNLKSYTQI